MMVFLMGVNWSTKGMVPVGVRFTMVRSQLVIYFAAMIMQSVRGTLYINLTSRKEKRRRKSFRKKLSQHII